MPATTRPRPDAHPPRLALLLINEKASGATKDLAAVQEVLEARGIRILREPTDPVRIPDLILAHRKRVDAVILSGGDGTIHLTLPALLQARLPVGILPLGTANDLARTLEIPSDLSAAARIIGAGHRRWIDVGRANGIPYLNAAQVGFGVEAAEQLTGDIKRRLRVWAYPLTLWKAWRGRRPFRIRLRVDQGPELRTRALHVTVANGRSYGGGLTVVHDARIDDQRLDVTVIRPQRFYELLGLVPMLRGGKRVDGRNLARVSGRSIQLQTSATRPIAMDGEIRTWTPALFDLAPKALEVFVPEQMTADVSAHDHTDVAP